MRSTSADLRFALRHWVACSTFALIALGVPGACAQCSQAALPELASSVKANSAAEATAPLVPTHESSSASQAAPSVRFETGRAITVLEETPLQVMNDMPISSRDTRHGAKLSFTVTRNVIVDGVLVVPCGASVYGTVVSAKQAGRLVGESHLTLQLTSLNLNGKSYPLYTPPFKVTGTSKTAPTVNKVVTGAAVGALAMEVRTDPAGQKATPGVRAKADAVAAGVGAGVGTAIAAASPASIVRIPPESQIEFTLAAPIAVYPVDQATAVRLARGMHRGGPVLYVRGESR